MHTPKLLARYRVDDGDGFRLRDHAPDDKGGGHVDHAQADAILAEGVVRLGHLQRLLYAQDRWSMLIILQAMDTAGKDGAIAHVLTGVNPQGVIVKSFKQPSIDELSHGFLWRAHKAMPPRGHIGIFNRSYYEDVLVSRVHPDLIDGEKLPDAVRGKKFFIHRLQDIAHFESYAAHQGTVILKFFLHLSKEEQKRRLLERIDEPAKNWKFSAADLHERHYWQDYQRYYEDAIAATATAHAPWYVVPADRKWFARLVIVEAITTALSELDLTMPDQGADLRDQLARAKAELLGE